MKIILVRNGDPVCGCDWASLSSLGMREIKEAAEKIVGLLVDTDKVIIFSSWRQRAKESADIIAARLGLSRLSLSEIQQREWLWACPQDTLIEELEKTRVAHSLVDALIIVSHAPEIEEIIKCFERKFEGKVDAFTIWFDRSVIKLGSVFLVDLKAEEIRKL